MHDYVVPGKVYIVYRYFPLPMHPFGHSCAEFACAASRIGRYQKVADALFAQQSSISVSGKVEDVVNSVLTPTEATKVKNLLHDPGVQREIQTDIDEGKSVPVTGTPTLWITHGGKSQALSWPIHYELLKSYLDALLAKK
jgi:protein-disulfide isomerase